MERTNHVELYGSDIEFTELAVGGKSLQLPTCLEL